MNANVGRTSRRGSFFMLALAAVACLATRPGPAPAQPRRLSDQEVLQRANRLYREDRLLEAEALYGQALKAAAGADCRLCYDRLLVIYVRVGRQDQAIQTGLSYEGWLRLTGDLARARELDLDLGRWYLALGHHAAAEPYLRKALADLKDLPLPPGHQVTALTQLALAAEKQGDRARAVRAWREVEGFARARLDGPGQQLDLAVRIECVRRLADSYRFQGRPAEAIPRLEAILPAFKILTQLDAAGWRDTLRQLAGHLAAARRPADAEMRLREALALHQEHAPKDRLTRADLSCALADVVEQQGRAREAAALRQQAAGAYRDVLEDARAGQPEQTGALDAFWKLQALYQRTSQYDWALKLTQDQSEQWPGSLIELRLHAEQGRLQVLLGDYGPSRRLLADAVRDLEKQTPPNLVELPVTLLNLAVAELANDSRGQAREVAQRCLALYRTHRLADDLVLVETYNLLGTCAAQDGDYAPAIDHYRAGIAGCAGLGPAADPVHCNLLLNIALLHKAQGDLDRVLPVCQEARTVYQRFAAPDALGFAALDAATVALLLAQGRLEEANALAPGILRRCTQHGIRGGPLVIAARHCQALWHLHQRDYLGAEQAWREVERLHGQQSPLRPRTLNYLALTRECQGRLDEAAELYAQAQRLQEQNPQAFPVTYFITLWRLANVANRRGRHAEARTLLGKATEVVEKARRRTYGDAQQRATFFAQFAPAFEQLVAWSVRDGDVTAAVVAMAAGRSRTLLDQLLLANVDPRQGLRGPAGEQLRQQETELRRRIAAKRASAQLLPPEALETKMARALLKELEQAQHDYNAVYREILNASPVYRSLAPQEFTAAALERLRDRALGPKKLLLVYHVGRHQSHLLLLGDRVLPPEAFALTVPADVAERVAPPAPVALARVLGKTRGLSLKPGWKQPDLPTPPTYAAHVPLGQAVLRALVENYLEQVTDPTFRPTRGLRLEPRDPARPLQAQRPELLAEILLPSAARVRLRALAPECVILIPDGALHKLPFEALLLQAGAQPIYVLDALPPLVYAPSVAILAQLTDRPRIVSAGPQGLLTVADPAYPRAVKEQTPGGGRPGLSAPLTQLPGQLPALPHTAQESARISRFFDPKQVLALRGAAATKKALVTALPGRQVVHIAAHGLADERFGNQFGGLALTPPAAGQETPDNDGFLALHEIYTLPLDRCELAVLSACVTHVGPQPPLEAGVTLAGGFLTAGARRVVASHWGVDDESTAELMAAFFQEVTAAAHAGRSVPYARALQQARRHVRDRPDWSAPYFWAPFVLVGPAD